MRNFAKSIMSSLAPRPKGRKIHTNEYDSSNHIQVLFKMYGSVWSKVLPFCILNVTICIIILYFKKYRGIDMTMSVVGHKFMGIIVSFLIVSRVTIVLSRLGEASSHLSTIYRATRELSQHMSAFTYYEQDKNAKEWRNDVAYHAMILLRVTMAVINYNSSRENAWDVPELDEEEKRHLRRNLIVRKSMMTKTDSTASNISGEGASRWAHGDRTEKDENIRVPIRMSYRLRTTIISQRKRLTNKLVILEELKLLSFVQDFMSGYYGLQKLIANPFPFPLVQMTRTFLLFFVYTLPFAILNNVSNEDFGTKLTAVIAITTYGFIGLEYISIEFDDPFGEDPNDFDNLGWAKTVFEDIYMTINDIDGQTYADKLRFKMSSKDASKSIYVPIQPVDLGSFVESDHESEPEDS